LPKSKPIITRHKSNPLLSTLEWPYPAAGLTCAAAAIVDGETLLLVQTQDRSGPSHLTVARSKDGVGKWRIDSEPTLLPSPASPEEEWGLEEPRLSWLEEAGCFAIACRARSPRGSVIALATTRDFKIFERLGAILPPASSEATVFPLTRDGKWLLLHRPDGSAGDALWLSRSPDLVHWGEHRQLLRARPGAFWDRELALAATPLRTEHGWLVLLAGAEGRHGLLLLDLADPARVLARSSEWHLGPTAAESELRCSGWTLVKDQVRLYLASRGVGLGLATARLDDLLGLLI